MSTLQQVNLISREYQGDKLPFSFLSMFRIWGIVVVFFVLLQSWGWYQTEKVGDYIAVLKEQQDAVLNQLETMRETSPQNRKIELDRKIAGTRAEMERRRQVLQILKARDMANESGFSAYLTGFSQQHHEGLSVDHFGLWEGGAYVELTGWIYRPELAPAYVQRLKGEEVFQNARFGNLTIERSQEQRTDALKFKFSEPGKDG